jgi:hypothetical protein
LIYLAWLWSNGFIIVEEFAPLKLFTAYADPRITDFDYDRYEGLDKQGTPGFNLYDTYYDFGLDKISHLLKMNKQEAKRKN